MMNKRGTVLSAIALCFAVGTLLAADMTIGTWKVNVATSKYSPGPPPKAQTLKVEAVKDSIKVTVDGTDAQGKSIQNEWTGKYDGRDYPVKGDPNSDMRSYQRIDDYNYEVVAKKAGKVTTTSKAVISRDGKSRTLTQTGTNPQGQKVKNTVVYEKQ